MLKRVKRRKKNFKVPSHAMQIQVFNPKDKDNVVKREFNFIAEVYDYVRGFIKGEKYTVSKSGLTTTLQSGLLIQTNYPMEDILKCRPVSSPLTPLFEKTTSTVEYNLKPKPKPKTIKSKKTVALEIGVLVPLKKLCQELELDPRVCRIALRKAIKGKKYPVMSKAYETHSRWSWPAGSDEIKEVRSLLEELE